MINKELIENIVNESFKDTGIFLVDIIVSRSNMIQVFIDHQDGVSLDDCVRLHQVIEQNLDREQEDFELQVSSPGLGQPMRVFAQYSKALGQKLEIVLQDGEILKGTLLEAKPGENIREGELVIRQAGTRKKPAPEEPVILPVRQIKTARVEIDFNKL